MTVFHLERWWKRKDHRKIRGTRGARFASLKFHAIFLMSVFALVEYVFRSTDAFTARHLPDPPVPAPPPMAKSLGYAVTSEMPHLKALEVELGPPPHVPQRETFNFKGLREEGRIS
ncbi:putative developmentally regulated protein [Leptomonas pyrrhocoris]|uniref:Putative developmentally regulated protein n=1 Tax=Leptomonas pyrrhocoris TaxID=157538 RepID=A0A0M9FSF5_LEPPY|nr:putative developmentally regulated protein [Leptomonas pyrrhocoris]XP_015653533.1 putative developmentally regulated protein [Leptomonas pyrrhocoris]KPA75093.1 putative developmentally regulated protein [Leptomonas pyrrhocoris]KPA75094.1 putative developmentally regulated protein [Leptomonas pyrrhocoris]|eukprot:XP_015653532.1 putative developmentally regulated protein [Leptomonas pyrrhocoris]